MSDIVPAYGPSPCPVLFIGKAPASEECRLGRPMVGRTGREHNAYLSRHDLSAWAFRTTNLVRSFVPPDTPLTSSLIDFWTPDLISEIRRTRPRLIVPIGAAPTRWLLGSEADIDTCHGIPHHPGAFDESLAGRAPEGTCVLPIIQPAAGFHDPDARALINWDYGQVAKAVELVRTGRMDEIDYRHDPYAGKEIYLDVTGRHLAKLIRRDCPPVIAIDTEGMPGEEWSIQTCWEDGVAYLLRYDQPDFHEAITALSWLRDRGTVFVGHNWMWDLGRCHTMSLDLYLAHLRDTLFNLYLLKLEPLGLKPAAWRWLGKRMRSHEETVGVVGIEHQIDYLRMVLEESRGWAKPEPFLKIENDGQMKIKKPKSIHVRVAKILADIEARGTAIEAEDDEGEDADDGESGGGKGPVDPRKRWLAIDRELRRPAERLLGRIPTGSMKLLAARDFDAALKYACDDAMATFRIDPKIMRELAEQGRTHLAEQAGVNIPVFWLMQHNGLPASRSAFISLRDRMQDEMLQLGSEISARFNDGMPFNPKSSQQTRALMDKLGLVGIKTTKMGEMSTGKKSIEHLAKGDQAHPFIVLLFEWRERQHIKDTFCRPTLDSMPDEDDHPDDLCWVRCSLLPWGTHNRRLASRRPNLLAQPKHSPLGKAVRNCYVAPPGYVFLESDLAAIEACVMAHLSGCQDLIRALTGKHKFHRVTASRFLNKAPEDVTPDEYHLFKTVIYGTFLGQSGRGLMEGLWAEGHTHYTEEECDAAIEGTKTRVYPGIARYEKRVEVELRRNGYVEDMWHHRRYLPGIWADRQGDRNEALRQAMSLKISAGAQGLIQNAISWLKDEVLHLSTEHGIDVRWLLTVHDSLLLLCPEWAAPIVQAKVEEGLTEHCGMRLRVEVKAESKVAGRWGEL